MGEKEKRFIEDNYKEMSIRQMSKIIGIDRKKISKYMKDNDLISNICKRLTKEEEEFIKNNCYLGCKYVAEQLNKSYRTILGYCQRNNLVYNIYRDYNDVFNEISNNIEEFKNNLYSNSMKDLANMYGVCNQTLYKIMKELNIKQKSKSIKEYNTNNCLNLNEDYFEFVNANQKAYYLGLIASDGCVYITKDYRQNILSISLLKEDGYILDFLYNELNLDKHPIIIDNKYAQLQVSSNKIIKDLSRYGIIPNKTHNLNIKNIPKEYYNAFLLGFFDGDGSINFNKNKPNLPSCYNINIAGTKSGLNSLANILNNKNLNYSIIEDKRKRYNCDFFGSIIFKNTTEKYIFLKEIYSENIVCLERKKRISMNLIYSIENNISKRGENLLAIEEYNKYKCRSK